MKNLGSLIGGETWICIRLKPVFMVSMNQTVIGLIAQGLIAPQ